MSQHELLKLLKISTNWLTLDDLIIMYNQTYKTKTTRNSVCRKLRKLHLMGFLDKDFFGYESIMVYRYKDKNRKVYK